ncbi:MAG: DUF512 domain-containing protein [candidate division KSB1 bacterium]|nr:DUF512 domain-containing protein [candidate division KSB1 bacterium]
MKIVAVGEGGVGCRLGLRPGDELRTLNGHRLLDELDLRFWSAEGIRSLEVERDGERVHIDCGEQDVYDLDIQLEPLRVRSCGNKCLFCFVDQNPPGMRHAVYLKDEDYRLSFLHGNYVTLSNAGRSDLLRIAELRLSPLYISVHATDTAVRMKLLGLRRDDRLLEKLAFLAGAGITMHAQVVICPGYNDGHVLAQTVDTLLEYFPQIATVAIVPVGLTRHRQGLAQLRGVDTFQAQQIVQEFERRAQELRNLFGSYFVYLADELYLLARHQVPLAGRYEDFSQVENGVGMVRRFLDTFQSEKRRLPRRLSKPTRATIATGTLAAPILAQVCAEITQIVENFELSVVAVENGFYGETVTVSGLLTGQDIYASLKNVHAGDVVFLPSNCLNSDGLFLDDWRPDHLAEKLNVPVCVVDSERIVQMFRAPLLRERGS